MSQAFRTLIFALLAGIGMPALASDDLYTFELILFERPGAVSDDLWPEAALLPDTETAARRVESLPAANKALDALATTLRRRGLIVHEHLAWQQVPAGLDNRSWLWIGNERVGGYLRINRGRFLHLDTDLVIRDVRSDQSVERARHYRRMRSGELHYVDHPRFGILVKAERFQSSPSPVQDDPTGEPRPADPGIAAPG